ncbi:histidine phosphatase family protein [Aspergillus undulatus]|uniref:histidine phosphatase family protein n=1 Tax=Aspergillus undulatus TaxID=1810928 RepID=UPI003CCCE7E9
MVLFTASISLFYLLSSTSASASASAPKNQSQSCNSIEHGYQCFPSISHLWGQYSPYFSLEQESAIPQAVPDSCIVTFAQVLSRHGARYPTESKSAKYADLISSIQSNISSSSFSGKYAFLKEYEYTLGADDLTAFGEDQMVDSGAKFYQRYKELAREITPFIRASGSGRVVASAEKFIEGFTKAKEDDHLSSRGDTATVNVILPETDGFNNTLDHSTCTAFESNEDADTIEDNFTSLIAPPIAKRLESDLPGITLTNNQVIYLMDMCSFDTVARSRTGTTLSPFCTLFTETEWIQYDYLQSLSKYYGYGAGATLGPAQGIGFTNELIARLTQSPVHDTTSTNRTFDADPATFPLDRRLYADFSHDNSMISIFFAMGLYNGTAPLSQSKVETIAEMDGYAASWTVPFGARAYFEVLDCEGEGETEPLVRVLVNDRVVPLHGCVVDEAGRCSFDEWVRGLSFARSGGNWWSCYAA